MKATKQFIEDAIEGGYNATNLRSLHMLLGCTGNARKAGLNTKLQAYYSYILLDPKAWQAVGKTRGWSHKYSVDTYIKYGNEGVSTERWLYEQHRFIDHLADGLSIEEALGKLV
tara:strand:+ start:25 stop:366 length:342 start_codon:yes stop_codon:yes gene_type:complete